MQGRDSPREPGRFRDKVKPTLSRDEHAGADPPKPIYVSLIVGGEGAENRTAIAAARAVGKLADEVGERIKPSGLKLLLTFHIAGSIIAPAYQGLRTGRYVPREELLDVQAAVPVPLATADDARAYITSVLQQTSRLVNAYVARRKLNVSTAATQAA